MLTKLDDINNLNVSTFRLLVRVLFNAMRNRQEDRKF